MSQSDKATYYQALKASGVRFEKHYRDYTTDELQRAFEKLQAGLAQNEEPEMPTDDEDLASAASAMGLVAEDEPPHPPPADETVPLYDPEPPATAPTPSPVRPRATAPRTAPPVQRPPLPVRGADPNEVAGARLNTKHEDEPIRVDEQGRIWFQEEVRKPAYPKPRGRRVLDYMDTGVKVAQARSGEYIESFEVPGDRVERPAQVKITLPSYQVGTYKDPRLPFKIHTYNGVEGFDLEEVEEFYGGPELVPDDVKRMYVQNVLCYDIRLTIRAIQTEYRQQQLAGRIQP